MKPEFKLRLTNSLTLPGVAAWCVCDASHGFEHHCYTDWFKPAQLEAVTAKLAGAVEGLRKRQVAARQFCWVFEHARLLLARRASGETLVVFVENRPDLNNAPYHAAMGEFAAGN